MKQVECLWKFFQMYALSAVSVYHLILHFVLAF